MTASTRLERAVTIVVAAAAAVAFLSMGARQTFGVFLIEVVDDLGTDRTTYSLALAIQNLLMGLPIAAMIADKMGHRPVVIAGSLMFGAGMWGTSMLDSASGLSTMLGVVAGLGLSALSLATLLGAVGRVVPPHRRTFLFGLITAGTSVGMAVMTPLSRVALDAVGWQSSFQLLAGLAFVMVVGGLMLPGRDVAGHGPVVDERLMRVLERARKNRSYVLLVSGFFVCGFHVAFIAAHLPAFFEGEGLSGTVAAGAVGIIGLFNIIGSMTFGWLGDRYRKRTLLTILYAARGVLFTLLLLVPINNLVAVLFSAAMGFVWLATAPLTSSTVAHLFGTRYMTSLYGVVFFSHQVGAFLGVYLGGALFDATGSYDIVWQLAIGLAILAAAVHWPIDDVGPGADERAALEAAVGSDG